MQNQGLAAWLVNLLQPRMICEAVDPPTFFETKTSTFEALMPDLALFVEKIKSAYVICCRKVRQGD
jgi:hypothetical protein